MNRSSIKYLVLCLAVSIGFPVVAAESYDLVVYGGTSGGIAAAVQSARMGRSVALIEPTQFLGGLTTGGLGATDIGSKQASNWRLVARILSTRL